MTEYITRVSALVAIEHAAGNERNLRDAFDTVAAITAADVAPVVHGRWITEWSDAAGVEYCCSRCAAVNKNGDSYYCPNCGAKMDGGQA